ncbi:MAG: FHA domain-containing protein [Myxococcota bacterium]
MSQNDTRVPIDPTSPPAGPRTTRSHSPEHGPVQTRPHHGQERTIRQRMGLTRRERGLQATLAGIRTGVRAKKPPMLQPLESSHGSASSASNEGWKRSFLRATNRRTREYSQQRPGSAGYLFQFISGRNQGCEFPVEVGREIMIGRSSDLDIVLAEEMVSRRHARIFFGISGRFYIEDLGSTNGTFINGEKIAACTPLQEGDRILIGNNILKLTEAAPSSSAAPSEAILPAIPIDGPSSQEVTAILPAIMPGQGHGLSPMPGKTAMHGLIDEMPLPNLLQFLGTSKKSGVLSVRPSLSNSGRLGRIYLRDGRVYYATLDARSDISPEKAFYRMLAWVSGTFALNEAPDEQFNHELEASTEAMMMEGMRQLDEIRNLGADIPPLEANLYIEQPLIPPLRALTPELLDTLQLIHNYVEVEAILNRSLASDLETLQDIIYLMRNEYVRIA